MHSKLVDMVAQLQALLQDKMNGVEGDVSKLKANLDQFGTDFPALRAKS